MFDVPYFGKKMFLKEAQKIIPTIKLANLEYGTGLGGIRPQIVNVRLKKLEMGEAKIIEDGIIFDITPSPGASVCLDNSRKNSITIGKFIKNFTFDEQRFLKDHELKY